MDKKSLADLTEACNSFRGNGPHYWVADAFRLLMGGGKSRWSRKVYDHIRDGNAQQNHNHHIADPSHHPATVNVIARKGRKNTPRVRGTRHVLP